MGKLLSSYYRYNWNVGLENHMMIAGIPEGYEGNMIDKEMNILSRYLWGIGASLDKVVNAVGFRIKFQGTVEDNIKRSRLLTKLWRYCKQNNIKITTRKFPLNPITGYPNYIWSEIITKINNSVQNLS